MAKERVGVLGGTFDPIHRGHIRMALSVLEAGHLDKLLILPSGDPPYKNCLTCKENRWKMTVIACAEDSRLVPSRMEIDRDGTIYTVDTLMLLKKTYSKADLFFVIGADALLNLRKWDRYEEVIPLCTFLVCPRAIPVPPDLFAAEKKRLTEMGARFVMVSMDPVTISSSAIRTDLAAGRSVSGLCVPVREFCMCKGLYGFPRRLDHSDEWIENLFIALNPHRFAHSLAVAYTARRLARVHGLNEDQAEQAGLLHDCAKCLPIKEMQQIAREHSLTDDPEVMKSSALLHSLVGAWVARNKYGMADPEVLDAISWHNTGRPGMSSLEMCVCLSDSIEPTRDSYPLLEHVRALSELSLERALLLSLEGTADFVRSRGKYLHPRTQETISWLKTLPGVRSSQKRI